MKIMRVGDLIEYIDERNTKKVVSNFQGINIKKEFMPTVADVDSVDSSKYKIVRKNRFVFSGMQTGRDQTIRIALFRNEEPVIVSPAYTTFEIKSTEVILPEYFFMTFMRKESDRLGWFLSDSSVRANLDLERFEDIQLYIPHISIQKKYVKLFKAINRVPTLSVKIQDICSVLIRGSIKEAEKNV